MPSGTIVRRVYFAALLTLLVATAGGAFSNAIFFIKQPYQLNYGEGLAAWQAAHVTDLARAYAPMDRYPFVVFQYPPLFHLATHAIGAGDFLEAGRIVSVFSAAILCVIAGWITFHALPRRTSRAMRILAAGFAAALPTTLYNFEWTWLARVDTLAILLSFSGVALFAARPTSVPAQLLASMLMVAGLFTRQTAFAAPLTCLAMAAFLDRRIALRMLIAMTILGGLALGWLVWRTNGQVLLHLFRYNQTAFSIARALVGVFRNGRAVAGPLIFAAGASGLILGHAWALVRSGHWKLLRVNLWANRYRRIVLTLATYSVFAALTTLANGKEGSDINYFLEWNVSLAPLSGIFLVRLLPARENGARLRSVRLAALALPLLILNIALPAAGTGWLRILGGPRPVDRQQIDDYRRMLTVIQETPGPVFSEDVNLLYKTGKEIPAEPAMIQVLAKAGLWDEQPFVRMIQEHRFTLVVTMLNRETQERFSRQRYSPAVAGAIGQEYVQTARIGDYMIFQPRTGIPQRP